MEQSDFDLEQNDCNSHPLVPQIKELVSKCSCSCIVAFHFIMINRILYETHNSVTRKVV